MSVSKQVMLVFALCAASLPRAANAKDLCEKLAGAEGWTGSFTLRVTREDGSSRESRSYNWTISGNVTLQPHEEDGTRRPAEWHAARQQYQASVDDVERDSQQNAVRIQLDDLESNSNQAHLTLNCSKGTYRFSVVAGIWREKRTLTFSDKVESQCARANPMLDMLCAQLRQRGKDLEREKHTFKVSAATSDHAFSPKSGALSGSEEVELGQHLLNGERLKANLSWSLSPGSQKPVEVTVEPPDDYQRWLPRGNLDAPGEAGSQLRFRLTVHEKGNPTARRRAKLKVMLIDVSNEKGVCMNWPPHGEPGKGLRLPRGENRDLTFAPAADFGETPEAVEKAEVVVASHDFGAWGKLHIEGVGQTVEVRFKDKVGDVRIPRDDDDNHIADEWDERHGAGPEAGDDDATPRGDGHTGDVLTRYEEYRGFRISGALDLGPGELVTGAHVRTSPLSKDVFIIDSLGRGVGQFGLSGLRVHLLAREEAGASSSRVKNPLSVNPNRGFATLGDQYPIVIEGGTSADDLGGAATVGLPRDCPFIQVDATKPDLLETITHELGHCTNVPHHGNEAILVRRVRVLQTYTDGPIVHPQGEVTPFPPGSFQLYFDGSGVSPASGDSHCFMHYVPAFVLSTSGDPNNLELTDQNDATHPGKASNRGHARYTKTRFCGEPSTWETTSKQVPAEGGNCMSRFCVNHRKH